MRVVVTGGSGFIGANTVDALIAEGIPVLNIDARAPLDRAHARHWTGCNLQDNATLHRLLHDFQPTHVIHLAARTDLRGSTPSDYTANTAGVESLLDAVESCASIQRVIYASSMLVCRLGYQPSGDTDYAPTTAYGESKVVGERLVRNRQQPNVTWAIARPCSIWGPRFGEPYRQFFETVLAGRFVKFGPQTVRKTFGYVGNTVYQLMRLLDAPADAIHRKVFYLGDDPPLNAGQWGSEIARVAGVAPPRQVPLALVRWAARLGDGLGRLGVAAPMTSFRLANMTTDNVIDLSAIRRIAPDPPFDLEQGIRRTLDWIRHSGEARA